MIYSALKPQDYVREKFYSSAPMGFELQSSSAGIVVTSPTDLVGAVTIEEATSDSTDETINPFSETQKYVLNKSAQHNFFRDAVFYSGSRQTTSSLVPETDTIVFSYPESVASMNSVATYSGSVYTVMGEGFKNTTGKDLIFNDFLFTLRKNGSPGDLAWYITEAVELSSTRIVPKGPNLTIYASGSIVESDISTIRGDVIVNVKDKNILLENNKSYATFVVASTSSSSPSNDIDIFRKLENPANANQIYHNGYDWETLPSGSWGYQPTIDNNFIATGISAESNYPVNSDSYVVSIGRNFYGERIKPGSFELSINAITEVVNDDGYGNLFVSQSGTGYLVGNIFYEDGVAIIKKGEFTGTGIGGGTVSADINSTGIIILGGDEISVDFSSDVQIIQHEIRVELNESQFNMSNNPSLNFNTEVTSSFSQSLEDVNAPIDSDGTYNYYRLMDAGIIKPYMTTIGLYDDDLNMVAIGKVSTPIQRTFDTKQIFIIRFQETGYDGI